MCVKLGVSHTKRRA